MTTRQTSSTKPMTFSRNVREIFIFLVVLVAASNLSGIFLIDRVTREEDARVVAQLDGVIEQLHRRWDETPAEARAALDLKTLAREWQVDELSISTLESDSAGGEQRWAYVGLDADTSAVVLGLLRPGSPPVLRSGWGIDGEYWRFVNRSEAWAKVPVVVSAGVTAPVLGALHRQFRLEMWVRGFILAAFVLFAIMFHRIVLLPFRDMRRRAADLVESGLLPEVPGQPNDDPEYVMATFDELVHRLIRQAHDNERRAVSSERRARSVERFNEYMLTSMSTGVLILGRDGRILRINHSAERILSIASADIIGKQFNQSRLYAEMIAIIEEGLKQGQVYARREMRVERQPGDGPLYLGINTSRIRNEFDEVVGLSVLVTDLTEIKRLYDELAENQRLADLGEMSAGLAHQLRNSMAAILGYGRLLRGVIGADEQKLAWVGSVITETQDTALMLQRFLDFARPLSGDRHPIDLNCVISDAIDATSDCARNAAVEVTFLAPARPAPGPLVGDHLASESGRVMAGDALLLKQVFINLIQNAIEAMPSGGRISISSRVEDVRRGSDASCVRTGSLRSRSEDPAAGPIGASSDHPRTAADSRTDSACVCQIEVADNGPGIAPENRIRIFHPFYTSKETGTGLGLPLAKKIAIFHGGNLTLEKSGPDGSVFLVTLPLETQRPAVDSSREGQRTPALSIR